MGYLVSNDPLVSVGAAAVSGGEYATFTTSTNLDLSGETGNCRVFADTTGGVLSVTLPTGTANQVIEVIDAGESAGSNIITIVGTIDGATNATIEANGGSRTISYSGSAWESSGGFNQFFERDAATSTIKAKNPDTLQSDILAAGDSGTAYSANPSSFTDAEANVDQGAGSWGNVTVPVDVSSGITYVGGVDIFDNENGGDTYNDTFLNSFMGQTAGTQYWIGTGNLIVDLGQDRTIYSAGLGDNTSQPSQSSFIPAQTILEYGSSSSGPWTEALNGFTGYDGVTEGETRETTLPSPVTARYWRLRSTNSANRLGCFYLNESSYPTTTNTFIHRATSVGANIDMATLSLTDDGDNAIVDGEVLIEYSTNGGSTWNGSQLGLAAAQALGVITSAGAFWLRYEMVGANRMKSSVVQSTATYTRATAGGMETFVDSVLAHKVTGDGTLFKSFTTAERDAISSPATGLTIYNTTTNAHNVYNGTSWVELGGGGGGALTVNEETLSATKTISDGDPEIQILDPNGSARDVVLPATPTEGSFFQITNANINIQNVDLSIKVGADSLTFILLGSGQDVSFVYTANGWVAYGNGYSTKRTAANTFENKRSVAMGESAYANILCVALGDSSSASATSVAIGGAANASGIYGLALGYAATADRGQGIALGREANTNANYQIAIGGRYMTGSTRHASLNKGTAGVNNGSMKNEEVSFYGSTTNATITELYLAGTYSNRATLKANSVMGFTMQIVAREAATNDCKCWDISGCIKRDGSNNTSLVGTVTKTVVGADAGAAAWDVTVDADDTNESLRVRVTGEASHNISWAANAQITERG